MTDIDKRLDNIEQQLQTIANHQAPVIPANAGIYSNYMPPQNDEIDLRELWNILWQGKWWIIGITFLFAVAGVAYALSLPNMYKSEGVYAPAQQKGGVGGLAAQYGGLSAMAGINLGGGASDDVDQAVALVTSWPFLEKIVEKNDLAPYVLAVKGWGEKTRKLAWDSERFDEKAWAWQVVDADKPAEPTSYQVFQRLSEFVEVKHDAKSGMVTLSVTYYSPDIAAEWVRLLMEAINKHFQNRDIVEAERNVTYLQQKISETTITEMQSVFYGMIEAQTKTLMLAEVSEEYLLKQVIPPKVAEQRSQPSRSLICILFILLGGFSSCAFVLGRGMLLGKLH